MHLEASGSLPLVTVVLGFKAGGTQDPEGLEGLTRVMVHMLRRGAGSLHAHEIERTIDGIGANLGEYVGLSSITVQLDLIRRSFDQGIDLLCMLLGEPTMDEAELARLLRETESDVLQTRNSDRALCGRAFRRQVFEAHPFSRRLSGLPESLRRIGRAHVLEQRKRLLTRENLVVALSGDIDAATAARAVERLGAALPSAHPTVRTLPDPVPRHGRSLVFVDKPERTQTQMLVGCVGTHPRDLDHTALMLANVVLGGTSSSRLMTEVRTRRGWSYGAYSHLPIDLCREAFSVWTHPSVSDAANCLALELDLLERWCDRGVSARELTFAKRHVLRSHAFEIDTASKRAQRRLTTWLYDLPDDYYDGFLARVRGTTVGDVNEAIRVRILLDGLVVAVTGTHAQIGERVAAAVPQLVEAKRIQFDVE
jgi:zinc protease